MNIVHKKVQQNGMALGGIGTGSVEICENGELNSFHIFNLGKWADREADKHNLNDLYNYNRNVLPFYIRTKQCEDIVKIRKLSHDTDEGEFRSLMYSWNKEIREIQWEPHFPICKLNYIDESLPVKINADFSSAFIPLDAKSSATPGFFVTFTVRNKSSKDVEVSLLGKLKNPINRGMKHRQLQNTLSADNGRVCITMKSKSTDKNPQNGSMSISANGGEISYIQNDFENFFQNYVMYGDFGTTEQSYLFGFRDTGRLPNLGLEELPLHILDLTDEQIRNMSNTQIQSVFEQLLNIASAAAPYKRICEIDERLLEDRKNKCNFICLLKNNMNQLLYDVQGNETWGDAALCSTFKLKPMEKKQIQFLISWHFPNHISEKGNFIGHMYDNWFNNAKQVNDFMAENAAELLTKTKDFAIALRDTTVHYSFSENWSNQLNTIIKCSWWSKAGEFAIWEGYGSCGFHTMDITFQGSFNLLALFPELQLAQMEMGAKLQREDGRVHHFFTPDFTSVDNGFDRVDMNPQFVLLVCRDYLWTGNIDYLKRLWKPIVRAMESIERLCSNGNCLPDKETASNTYDAWHFKGIPSYIGSLWLASLLAAQRMANDLGETFLSKKWHAMLKKGSESFTKILWNGEYFSLWVDEEIRDECCMADQIDGQWYAQLIGLGEFIPKEQMTMALNAVLKYNYSDEAGLQNAIYPGNQKPTIFTYQNVQALANWSGIEFAFASCLLENGMSESAQKLSANVDQRYLNAGRIFNHQECGDHYYRAMSSWALLLSITGFKLDVPHKTVTIAPNDICIKAPWFAPAGYGSFHKQSSSFTIVCNQGNLCFKKLILNGSAKIKSISLNGKALDFMDTTVNNRIYIEFDENIQLLSGGKLAVF